MKVLSGKYEGRTARLHQFANDWITADIGAVQSVVLKPHQVELDDGEYERMHESYLRFCQDGRAGGQFWKHWQLLASGRLARRAQQAST
jgi:hypothetical protein